MAPRGARRASRGLLLPLCPFVQFYLAATAALATSPTGPLQVDGGRLLAYQWPASEKPGAQLKNSSALRAVLLLSVFFGAAQGAGAADFNKLFGNWTFARSTPNPNMPGIRCGASMYAFAPGAETVRLVGGTMNGALIHTDVKYVSGGGNLIGVYGNSGQPTMFRLLDDNHIQRDDDLLQCVFARQK